MSEKRFVKRLVLCLLCVALHLTLCSCGSANSKEGTEGLEYEANDGSYIVTGYHGTDAHVVIPDTHNGIPVTEIFEFAFDDSEIQSVTIGGNVIRIWKGAFRNASLLKEVYIPASVEEIGDTGHYAGVFKGCVSLEKVTIEKGSDLQCIGYATFTMCESLKEIALPEGLQIIGDSAFSDCTSLEEITLPEGLRTIGDSAFSACTSLNQLVIPATVDYVGAVAFSYFTETQEIIIKGSTAGWEFEERGSWNLGCRAQITYG